jgi:hypothetical protein
MQMIRQMERHSLCLFYVVNVKNVLKLTVHTALKCDIIISSRN